MRRQRHNPYRKTATDKPEDTELTGLFILLLVTFGSFRVSEPWKILPHSWDSNAPKEAFMFSRFFPKVAFALVAAGFLAGLLLLGQEQNVPGSKSVASVDGIAISETQLRSAASKDLGTLQLQMLKARASFARSEQAILERALNRLVEDKLLQAEATKQGITKEELLAKELKPGAEEPSNEEIEAFYEANKQSINKSKEDAAPQIKQYLKRQKDANARNALMKRLEKEHKVTLSLEPLRFDVNASGRPSLGPASAPVTLIEFSDFQCPYCKSLSSTLKEVVKQYGDKVRLVFRQLPLASIHPFAEKAAVASLCAEAQGHFWEMHDLLFEDQSKLQDEDLKNKAATLGLDADAFNKCLDSGRFGAMINEDVLAGARAGVDATPTLFINGRFLQGGHPYEEIAAIIDEELTRK